VTVNPKLEYRRLRLMYLDGWSYEQIARHLGVNKSSVGNALKRGTLQRGLPWPIRAPGRPVARYDERDDYVHACGVAECIRGLRRAGVPYVTFAERAGVPQTTVHELVAPHPRWSYIRIDRATRLMRVVEELESELGVSV